MIEAHLCRNEAERQIDFAEWIDPELRDEWAAADDQDDRFPIYLAALFLAAFSLVLLAWWGW